MIPSNQFDISLSEIFDRYQGKKILLLEETEQATGKRVMSAPEDQNPVLAQIRDTAESIGLQMRVWTPTTVGTKNFFKNRINIILKKTDSDESLWHIARINDDSGNPVASLEKSAVTPEILHALEEARKPPAPAPVPQASEKDITLLSMPAVRSRLKSFSA